MTDTSIFHKQIDLVQSCITRMAHNSFLIKGWTVGLLTIVLAITKNLHWQCMIIVFLPLLSFWYLDAYFLRVEKLYRVMYRNLITTNDFDPKFYDLDPNKFNNEIECICCVMFSHTLFIFYGALFALSGLISYLINCGVFT